MRVKAAIFTTFLIMSLFSSGFSWTKGPVTDSALTSLWGDLFVNYYNFHTSGKTWNETLHNYEGVTFDGRGDLAFPNLIPWPSCAYYLAMDGSDAQVAKTGLSRDELLRRARLDSSHIYIANGLNSAGNFKSAPYTRVPYTKAGFDSVIARARQIYASPRVTPAGFGLRPDHAKGISMSWNWRNDYGNSKNYITTVMVPQDLADPRPIAGRAIKDWIKDYWWGPTSGKGGAYGYNAPFIEPSYAPDYSADHHWMMEPWYASCHLDAWHTGIDVQVFNQLIEMNNLDEYLTSPLNHLRDLWKRFALFTGPNGWFVEVQSFNEYAPYRPYRDNSWASAIYRDPVARALAARSIEEHAKRKPVMGKPYGHETESDGIHSAYWIHRLLGGSDTALSYAEAVKRLHGTYWLRNYRCAYHRTPDKIVAVSWNGVARGGCGSVKKGEHWENLANGNDSLCTIHSTVYINSCYMNTSIIPDNDSLRPDDETAFSVATSYSTPIVTCMQGIIDKLSYTQHNAVVKNNRSDAILNTSGFMPHVCNRNMVCKHSAYQYQSLSSFYDKTCISLVQINKGSYPVCGTVNSWLMGFGNGIITDSSLGEKRDCFYEQGTLDLTKPNGIQNLSTSRWWSVNGRIGVATKGGNGQFKVRPHLLNRYEPQTTVIGWDETFSSSSSQWVNMAAAYYTDTPPDQVKYLQSTLLSLDSLLPVGWKGLVSETPDSQRVMSIARFHSDSSVAKFTLTFPEGAPVVEVPAAIRGNKTAVSLSFDSLQTLGQTMAFYVTGETDTVFAEQISDIVVRLKGAGTAKLVYLARTVSSTVDINGVKTSKTKQELKAGIDIALNSNWTVVRISNWIEEDHTAPAVEVTSPQYYSDVQTELAGDPQPDTVIQFKPLTQPDRVVIPDSGLLVTIMAKDRSGVSWVKVYLDWDSAGIITRDPLDMNAPYSLTIPKSKFGADSSFHAVHAIACDVFGSVDTSVSVPFRVDMSGGTGIERRTGAGNPALRVSSARAFTHHLSSATAKAVSPAKTKVSMLSETAAGVIRGRVQAKANVSAAVSGLCFKRGETEYVFGLDAEKGRAVLLRKSGSALTPVGDAAADVRSGVWYNLKVLAANGKITGYVNGEEKIAITH